MDYVKLFIVDGLFGYVLQAVGFVIAIAAFNGKPFSKKDFFLCILLFSLVSVWRPANRRDQFWLPYHPHHDDLQRYCDLYL